MGSKFFGPPEMEAFTGKNAWPGWAKPKPSRLVQRLGADQQIGHGAGFDPKNQGRM